MCALVCRYVLDRQTGTYRQTYIHDTYIHDIYIQQYSHLCTSHTLLRLALTLSIYGDKKAIFFKFKYLQAATSADTGCVTECVCVPDFTKRSISDTPIWAVPVCVMDIR